jgi:hypothetical protein
MNTQGLNLLQIKNNFMKLTVLSVFAFSNQ